MSPSCLIPWYGGKARMAPSILSLLPSHASYVEVFGGGASLLFAKRPSVTETYNDLDDGLVTFFRVLRDPGKARQLKHLLDLTPHSRTDYRACKNWKLDDASDVERARRWFTVACTSFSGRWGSSWGYTTSYRSAAHSFRDKIDRLEGYARRFSRVQVEHLDFREVIPKYDSPETLFYLDPPYLADTRADQKGYRHEMTEQDHRDLLGVLHEIRGMAVLSGYQSALYSTLDDSGWGRRQFTVDCPSHGRTRMTGKRGKGACSGDEHRRTEVVWMCPKTSREIEREMLFG